MTILFVIQVSHEDGVPPFFTRLLARDISSCIHLLNVRLFLRISDSQLTPWTHNPVSIWFYVSFRQVSFNHSCRGQTPESFTLRPLHHQIYGSVRSKKKKKRKTLKRDGRRGELMMNIDQVFLERSLQRQMAALCCSANVPYHNRFWFSSSISFILGVTH